MVFLGTHRTFLGCCAFCSSVDLDLGGNDEPRNLHDCNFDYGIN